MSENLLKGKIIKRRIQPREDDAEVHMTGAQNSKNRHHVHKVIKLTPLESVSKTGSSNVSDSAEPMFDSVLLDDIGPRVRKSFVNSNEISDEYLVYGQMGTPEYHFIELVGGKLQIKDVNRYFFTVKDEDQLIVSPALKDLVMETDLHLRELIGEHKYKKYNLHDIIHKKATSDLMLLNLMVKLAACLFNKNKYALQKRDYSAKIIDSNIEEIRIIDQYIRNYFNLNSVSKIVKKYRRRPRFFDD